MKLITKLGTNAVFDFKNNSIRKPVLEQLAKDARVLMSNGDELIVVTSGAVGCGTQILKGKDGIRLKQAQAAVGQPILMSEYRAAFNKYGLEIAQWLLTYSDLDSELRRENIKLGYEHLKKEKIIPIVNENDTTAIEELKFGDNDNLALELAIKLDFDTLINYTQRGALIKLNLPVHITSLFNPEYYDKIEKSGIGSGGLKSKLDCAKKACELEKKYIIAKAGDSIMDVLEGNVNATRFLIFNGENWDKFFIDNS
jgi:glutamate 5-kinase